MTLPQQGGGNIFGCLIYLSSCILVFIYIELINYLIKMCEFAVFCFVPDPLNKPLSPEGKVFDLFDQSGPPQAHWIAPSLVLKSRSLKQHRRQCCITAFVVVCFGVTGFGPASAD